MKLITKITAAAAGALLAGGLAMPAEAASRVRVSSSSYEGTYAFFFSSRNCTTGRLSGPIERGNSFTRSGINSVRGGTSYMPLLGTNVSSGRRVYGTNATGSPRNYSCIDLRKDSTDSANDIWSVQVFKQSVPIGG